MQPAFPRSLGVRSLDSAARESYLVSQPLRVRFHRLNVIEDDLESSGDWDCQY